MDQEQATNDILEIVQFLKDNSATKQDLSEVAGELRSEIQDVKTELRTEIQTVKTEVITHVDGLAVLHQRLDTELAALRAKYDRLESHVLLLAKHTNVQLDF